MKFKKLLTLGLVGVSALTGAFMLTGCGEEKKPAEIKQLEQVMAQHKGKDVTITMNMTATSSDLDLGGAMGDFSIPMEVTMQYDFDNKISKMYMSMEDDDYTTIETMYMYARNNNTYIDIETVSGSGEDLFTYTDTSFARGLRAWDLSTTNESIFMLEDDIWEGGKVTQTIDSEGNTVVSIKNVMKQSFKMEGIKYSVKITMETLYTYNESGIIKFSATVDTYNKVEFDGEVEEYTATSVVDAVVTYEELHLEVPANVIDREAGATEIDVDDLLDMYENMLEGSDDGDLDDWM